jgi:hypothetical protein
LIKKWLVIKYLIFVLVVCCQVKSFSQNLETTRAFAYDRGMISASEPFAPTGNPALLSLKNNLRFNLEYYHTNTDNYSISLTYPLTSSTGLGIYYTSRYDDNVFNISSGAFEVIQRNQTFLISLGHDYLFRFGQQIEVDFDLNRYSTIHMIENETSPFSNDQLFTCSYRLGFYKQLFDKIKLGILTPPLFQFHYNSFIDSTINPKANWNFWQESSCQTNMLLLAIEWKLLPNLGLVLSNRSKFQKNNFQLASEFRIRNVAMTHAITKDIDTNKLNYILGIGSYYRGFELFSAFDIYNKGFRFAASFAPERRKKLISLKDIEIFDNPIYPYRVKHKNSNSFASVIIENTTENPIELTINLRGRHLPTLINSAVLERKATSSISIPYPPYLVDVMAGSYLYSFEILAYSRGKQIINRTVSFEMKDKHDWSGAPEDLVYFIEPENEQIIKKAKNIISTYSTKNFNSNALAIAERFYGFMQDSITFICDPLQDKQDRIQYPLELLASKSGDCEDLSILMVSLLRSVGINASFIEIINPSINEGHIFILFDSQKSTSEILAEKSNLQNYIIRKSEHGIPKAFIPLELSKTNLSFVEAWYYAIDTYHTIAIENDGLARGIVKFIDFP